MDIRLLQSCQDQCMKSIEELGSRQEKQYTKIDEIDDRVLRIEIKLGDRLK